MMERREMLAGIAASAALLQDQAACGANAMKHSRGFNLIQTANSPLGSPGAGQALEALRKTGADTVALVPFFWQAKSDSPDLVAGSDMTAEQLRLGIRAAHAVGLKVMVKPHIWIPTGWAGLVGMKDEPAWAQWFGNFKREIGNMARIASEERAAMFCIGTEFLKTIHRLEWSMVISQVRSLYSGPIVYMAHGADEVDIVPFWAELDFVGVTLYPVLGKDDDMPGWRRAMLTEYSRVEAVAKRYGKPVWVGEIGLRSAQYAALKPWESAEERAAEPAQDLQAQVLLTWLEVLDRASVAGILIWRWLSDPAAGGAMDTDFTVQHKMAEAALTRYWLRSGTKAR